MTYTQVEHTMAAIQLGFLFILISAAFIGAALVCKALQRLLGGKQ